MALCRAWTRCILRVVERVGKLRDWGRGWGLSQLGGNLGLTISGARCVSHRSGTSGFQGLYAKSPFRQAGSECLLYFSLASSSPLTSVFLSPLPSLSPPPTHNIPLQLPSPIRGESVLTGSLGRADTLSQSLRPTLPSRVALPLS